MMDDGAEISSAADANWKPGETAGQSASLTERLGCTHTTVDVFRHGPDEHVSPRTSREQVCVPLDASGLVTADGTHPVPRRGIAFVPAGVACELTGEAQNTWLVVSAPGETAPDADPDVVIPEEVSYEKAGSDSTRSVPTIGRLTARLNAQGMKVNVWRLEPDEFVAYHREGTQEELYIPLDGPGTMRIAGAEYPIGAGAVARVAPELGRSPVNDGSEPRLWLMIGAPATGGPNEWDPGAEILEWPGSSG